jgi:hypothetical protein
MLVPDDVLLQNYVDPLPASLGSVRLAPISEQADLAEYAGTESLYFCADPWALRHFFINNATGEMVRARCDRWNCLYCGPRKTDQWRQLIAAAEPALHIVLSRAGHTVEESARALTTWVQYLRRGSKGRGRSRVDARPGFPIEYFAVLERHANFEETGFHWHVLINGIDYVPKAILDASWSSATHGLNRFAYVDRVKNGRAVGYVTKYLTKEITRQEKGTKEEYHEAVDLGLDAAGNPVMQKVMRKQEVESNARRIRYSRHFFPEAVEDLRFKLFSRLEDPDQIERESVLPERLNMGNVDGDETRSDDINEYMDQKEHIQDQEEKRPSWSLYEQDSFTSDIKEYRARRRAALLESLMEVRAGRWWISGRVLSVWSYQRSQRQRQGQ